MQLAYAFLTGLEGGRERNRLHIQERGLKWLVIIEESEKEKALGM